MNFGFMQGRLSPQVDGKIQAFPAEHWREEFPAAKAIGFPKIEWTLDQDGLYENPLMTADGQREIAELGQRHDLRVVAITGDCFMQAPFWKAADQASRNTLEEDFLAIVRAASSVGAGIVVVPLVDGGRIETDEQQDLLTRVMVRNTPTLAELGVRISFESDFPPVQLAEFIAQFDPAVFGVNYDLGNSASLGYDAAEEWANYGDRVIHVHLKDRVRNGTTVPLGTGDVDFPKVFKSIRAAGYNGHYVMQTARATDGDHAGALVRYARFCADLMRQEGLVD
jgi:L-ribulose-5-phosphate 3-epimerase